MNLKFSIFTPLRYTLNILAIFNLTTSGILWSSFNIILSIFEKENK